MRWIIVTVVIVLFFGCSSRLTVQVDIFDSKGLNPDDILEATVQREAAQHAYLLRAGAYARTKVDLSSQSRKYLGLLVTAKSPIVSSGDIDKFAQEASRQINAAVDNAVRTRDEGLEQTTMAATITKSEERRQAFELALVKFSSATQMLVQIRSDVFKPMEGELKKILEGLQIERTPNLTLINRIINTKSSVNEAIQKNYKALTGGLDLFDDPLAAIIISAPENYWQGVFNKTEASGQIGNTDIAIKMETIGTFTIKGVRLDAAKVTQASFQVLKKSVQLVAAAYGVPVPGSTPPPAGATSTETATDIVANIDQLRQEAVYKRQISRFAALTLLDLIIAEQSDLLSNNNILRKEAVGRVKKSFAAYKSQLQGQ